MSVLSGNSAGANIAHQMALRLGMQETVLGFNVSVRLYLPNNGITETQKRPILVCYHGGGFVVESSFSPLTSDDFLSVLVYEANVIAVMVEYRLAKVCTLPCAYDDSWIASYLYGDGHEDWINQHVDFQ
ncbi:hypothetical protein Q3G72_017519 [Acer saccharum]|nr:hypothetical protein Q3G72_017519 [Acer saccharum]